MQKILDIQKNTKLNINVSATHEALQEIGSCLGHPFGPLQMVLDIRSCVKCTHLVNVPGFKQPEMPVSASGLQD